MIENTQILTEENEKLKEDLTHANKLIAELQTKNYSNKALDQIETLHLENQTIKTNLEETKKLNSDLELQVLFHQIQKFSL